MIQVRDNASEDDGAKRIHFRDTWDAELMSLDER